MTEHINSLLQKKPNRREALQLACSFSLFGMVAGILTGGCGGGGGGGGSTDSFGNSAGNGAGSPTNNGGTATLTSEDLAEPPFYVDQENAPDVAEDQSNLDEVGVADEPTRQIFIATDQPWVLDRRSKRAWRATATATLIPARMLGNKEVTISFVDVVDSNGTPGVRWAYKKKGGSWVRSVLYGADLISLTIPTGVAVNLRLAWSDVNPVAWAEKLYDKAKGAILAALDRLGNEIKQYAGEAVKRALEEARGALKNAINYIAQFADLNLVAQFLITLVTTSGSPKEKLVAAFKQTAKSAVTSAVVAAIAAA